MLYSKKITSVHKQQGITMIVTLVVLLVLTIISVAAIDSNNLQSLMTRNNQFRLETFNASSTEIEAQIDYYSASDDPLDSPPIDFLLKSGIDTSLDSEATGSLLVKKSTNPGFTKKLMLTYSGRCATYGATQNINLGGTAGIRGSKSCLAFSLDSSAEYDNPTIISEQVQTLAMYGIED